MRLAELDGALVGDVSSPVVEKPRSKPISIRLVSRDDYDGLLALLQVHHANTAFADYAFSESQFRKQFEKAVEPVDHVAGLVAERNGVIVGCLWATVGRYALSEDLKFTTVHVIAVNSDMLSPMARARTFGRLLKGVRKWSSANGAQKVLVHVTTGTNLKATDRLMRASGAEMIGGSYVVE